MSHVCKAAQPVFRYTKNCVRAGGLVTARSWGAAGAQLRGTPLAESGGRYRRPSVPWRSFGGVAGSDGGDGFDPLRGGKFGEAVPLSRADLAGVGAGDTDRVQGAEEALFGVIDEQRAAEAGLSGDLSGELAGEAEQTEKEFDTSSLPGGIERKLPRRFYDSVSIAPTDAYGNQLPEDTPESKAAFWQVLLDGKPSRTLGVAPLLAPNRELALAIAAEFGAQRDTVHPLSTPLYNILSTVIDRFPEESERLYQRLADYLETDTVCYRVGLNTGDPRDAVCHRRQEKYYRPLIEWFEQHFGGPLDVVEGIRMPKHPEGVADRMLASVEGADNHLKAVIGYILDSTKSTVITMALLHRFISVDQAFHASRVEEEHQIEEGGFVYDGHDVQRATQRVRLAAASTYLWMVPESAPPKLKKIGADDKAAKQKRKRASSE